MARSIVLMLGMIRIRLISYRQSYFFHYQFKTENSYIAINKVIIILVSYHLLQIHDN